MRQRATNPCTIILLFVFTSACGAPTDPVDESSSKAAHRPPSQASTPPRREKRLGGPPQEPISYYAVFLGQEAIVATKNEQDSRAANERR